MALQYELPPHIQTNVRAALDEDMRENTPTSILMEQLATRPSPQAGKSLVIPREREREADNRDAATSNLDLTAQLIPPQQAAKLGGMMQMLPTRKTA